MPAGSPPTQPDAALHWDVAGWRVQHTDEGIVTVASCSDLVSMREAEGMGQVGGVIAALLAVVVVGAFLAGIPQDLGRDVYRGAKRFKKGRIGWYILGTAMVGAVVYGAVRTWDTPAYYGLVAAIVLARIAVAVWPVNKPKRPSP